MTAWTIGFVEVRETLEGSDLLGAVSLAGEAGPSLVRISWGSNGPLGLDPDPVFYAPEADGSFLPGERLYADGSYVIRALAFLDGGATQLERLTVTLALNNPDGVTIAGSGLSDLIRGGGGDDSLAGRNGDDLLYGGGGFDTLAGGNGADRLFGGRASDLLAGGDGADTLGGDPNPLRPGEEDGFGSDTLSGGAGDDSLDGDLGDDRLIGGDGADTFDGGGGNDTLVAGADGAADLFVFDILEGGVDRVVGFEAAHDAFFILNVDGFDFTPERLVSDAGGITDDGTWIIYGASGQLWLDTNGTQAGGLYALAVLAGAPTLGFDNFIFFGAS